MIAIVDYGMGNIQSVANALEVLNRDFRITNTVSDIQQADAIILPGVGAFGKGMYNLQEYGLIDVLNTEVIDRKKPYLGICLGLQFLAEYGYEHGIHQGFGWVRGTVDLIETYNQTLKVPHMGWNDIHIKKHEGLFRGLGEQFTCYFVHSYRLVVDKLDHDIVTSTCEYGQEIIASVQKENIFATQFHPEKSQNVGLKILQNFCSLVEETKQIV